MHICIDLCYSFFAKKETEISIFVERRFLIVPSRMSTTESQHQEESHFSTRFVFIDDHLNRIYMNRIFRNNEFLLLQIFRF